MTEQGDDVLRLRARVATAMTTQHFAVVLCEEKGGAWVDG